MKSEESPSLYEPGVVRSASRESQQQSAYSVDGSSHALVDMVLTLVALYYANQFRLLDWLPFEQLQSHTVPGWLYPLVCLIWVTVFSYHGVYERRTPTAASTRFFAIVRSVFLSTLLLAGALYFSHRELSRGYFLIFLILNIPMLLGWRYLLRAAQSLPALSWLGKFRLSSSGTRRVLIVGANAAGERIRSQLATGKYESISIVGFADDQTDQTKNVLGPLDKVRDLVVQHGVDDVIVTLNMDQHKSTSDVVGALEDLPVVVRVIPDYFSLSMYKTQAEEFGGVALMNLRAPAIGSVQRLYKRLFDIFASIILILVLSPVYLITALLIRLDSPGPVLFFQERVGENGKKFKMFKFRSMVVNAEAMQSSVNEVNAHGKILHKQKNDVRVTKVGRFIRSKSIDELPQLFNVVNGDMSLVGPRPELPWLVDQYDRLQRRRFAVPQGITGWWQINGRSDKPMHLNTDDDLFYINNYSFWLDLLILVRTPLIVISGKGAF